MKNVVDTFIGNVGKEGYKGPERSGITHVDFHTGKETSVENDSLERDKTLDCISFSETFEKLCNSSIVPNSEILTIEPLFSDLPYEKREKFYSKQKPVSYLHKDPQTCDDGEVFSCIEGDYYKAHYRDLLRNNMFCNSSFVMPCSKSDDATVILDERSDYSKFLHLVKARTAMLASIRSFKSSRESTDSIEHPSGICFDELYKFSRWKKFTVGRPKTKVFFHGKTYTYEKLAPFPLDKKDLKSKSKTTRKKKTVASPGTLNHDEEAALQNGSVTLNSLGIPTLNPLAPVFVFNGTSSFKNSSSALNELRVGNVGNIIIAHLNINS